MRTDEPLIMLSEVDHVCSLAVSFEHVPDQEMSVSVGPLVDGFISSFPCCKVSAVIHDTRKLNASGYGPVAPKNIKSDNPFQFEYGCWFICSEKPLGMKFAECNKMLGWGARIPFGNWRSDFTRWAADILQRTGASCIAVMDVDNSRLTICFWPADKQEILGHVKPIAEKLGLRISTENTEKRKQRAE